MYVAITRCIVAYHFMCVLYYACAGSVLSVEVNDEATSAINSAHQLNNLECFSNDEASDYQAVKCCIDDHYGYYGRRQCKIVGATATNRQSM